MSMKSRLVGLALLIPFVGGGSALLWSGQASQAPPTGRAPSASTTTEEPPSSFPPVSNVILITIDTLRADRLGAYGYPRPTSPHIDRFLAKGVRFEWAFSAASYTAPSHISLMTGLYPSFNSVMLDNGRFFKLAGKTTTLAELCRDAGMRTAAVVSNPTLNRRLGLHQGFATYCDLLFDPKHVSYVPKDAAGTTQEALELLELIHDAPFFLWVHYQDPHGPYNPPGDLTDFGDPPVPPEKERLLELGTDTSGYRAIPTYQALGEERRFSRYSLRYDNEILYLDRWIQRLFDAFERFDLHENSLIVLTADHGEAFSEDEFYFAHSHSVGLDQVRVPLGFVGKGVKPGVTLKTPAAGVDVFETLRGALRLPTLPTQGRSLLSALRDGRELEDKPVFVESFSQRGVVARGVFYRADRREPDDAIWTVSPTTNGFYKPLGSQLIRLSDRQVPPLEQGAFQEAELNAFSLQAEEAIRGFFDELLRTSKEDRTDAEQNGLLFFKEKLGYDFDVKDLEPQAKRPLSPEEQAQRRAIQSLGYLDEEKDDDE